MYVLFLIFLEFRNTLKWYAEIGQYQNISFHWINWNGFWNSIHNIAFENLVWGVLAVVLPKSE